MGTQKRKEFHERPMAAAGLTSYRLKGPFGWIMIGAKDHDDAMREALRSTREPDRSKLEVWDGNRYVPVDPVSSARIKFDFTDCDDSGAQAHVVEPATADEVEAAIAAFFAEFTAPRLTREMRT